MCGAPTRTGGRVPSNRHVGCAIGLQQLNTRTRLIPAEHAHSRSPGLGCFRHIRHLPPGSATPPTHTQKHTHTHTPEFSNFVSPMAPFSPLSCRYTSPSVPAPRTSDVKTCTSYSNCCLPACVCDGRVQGHGQGQGQGQAAKSKCQRKAVTAGHPGLRKRSRAGGDVSHGGLGCSRGLSLHRSRTMSSIPEKGEGWALHMSSRLQHVPLQSSACQVLHHLKEPHEHLTGRSAFMCLSHRGEEVRRSLATKKAIYSLFLVLLGNR